MADATYRRRVGRVRLTRRGRVVFSGLAVLLAAAVALLVLVALKVPSSRASGPETPFRSAPPTVAVVLPGDTLWSVVTRHAPSRDPVDMIEEIRRLNGLSGSIIHPGQELLLPAR
jgi:hypothetical protein